MIRYHIYRDPWERKMPRYQDPSSIRHTVSDCPGEVEHPPTPIGTPPDGIIWQEERDHYQGSEVDSEWTESDEWTEPDPEEIVTPPPSAKNVQDRENGYNEDTIGASGGSGKHMSPVGNPVSEESHEELAKGKGRDN
jgi:hypothetical protein